MRGQPRSCWPRPQAGFAARVLPWGVRARLGSICSLDRILTLIVTLIAGAGAEFLADSFQSNLLRTLHDGDAFSDATVMLGRQVLPCLREAVHTWC